MYADDLKIYLEIESNADCFVLQQGIDKLVDWSNTWQLSLATSKCMHMRIGLNRCTMPAKYCINSQLLESVSGLRDLGVNVDSHLNFVSHINQIAAKAHVRSSQILRCFLSKDVATLVKAFVIYVRPILDYCTTVWSPCAKTHIDKIESVQRMFTKRLSGMRKFSYDERLKRINLDRLELRRIHTDIITCYKILHGFIDVNPDHFFTLATHTQTRGHSCKNYSIQFLESTCVPIFSLFELFMCGINYLNICGIL